PRLQNPSGKHRREGMERCRQTGAWTNMASGVIGGGRSLHNVAVLRQYQGRDAEALALAHDALEAAETSLPRGHLKIGRYRDHLGTCLTALGRFAEAERELLEAYDSLRGQLGGGHPYTQKVVADLIDLYEAWGKPAQAAEWKTRLDEIEVDALSVP
ncbi:MAG: tetratricopeptide repeat protein, partial [Planctomycetota bacterium]